MSAVPQRSEDCLSTGISLGLRSLGASSRRTGIRHDGMQNGECVLVENQP